MLKLDTSDFEEALYAYQEATDKDMAEVTNRGAKNLAMRAAQFTEFVSRSRIKQDLTKDAHLLAALTAIEVKRKGGNSKLSKGEFKAAMEAFLARRMNTGKYLRAGWAKSITDMGGTYRGATMQGAGGYGEKATEHALFAVLEWSIGEPNTFKAGTAEEIAEHAAQLALDFVTEDMLDYAAKRMQQTASKYSA